MANPEHLEILKQSVDAWNQWREKNPEVMPDLSGADLGKADLHHADLRYAILKNASLGGADLSATVLSGADLSKADLYMATLNDAVLSGADLSGTALVNANLRRGALVGTLLRGALLRRADLSEAELHDADFSGAIIGWVIFGDNDLSSVKGLDTVKHYGPSIIGIDTIYKSVGKIPEVFLRGCGVPENFIAYMSSLVGSPWEFYSCFISYSSKNQDFAERIYADLQSKNVRCWFAPEDLKIGDKFRLRIDESIRVYDKLLLILSDHSVASQWVEKEVETAMERERELGRDAAVLFPIKLDDAIEMENSGWAADVRRTRHIGDFRNWKNHDDYQKAFKRLLRDLRAESKSQ